MPTIIVSDARGGYRDLAEQVRDAGLFWRRPWYHSSKIAVTVVGFAAACAALLILGNSWAALGAAAFLGVVLTQVVLTKVVVIGHDAGHQQIVRSRRAKGPIGLAAGDLTTAGRTSLPAGVGGAGPGRDDPWRTGGEGEPAAGHVRVSAHLVRARGADAT